MQKRWILWGVGWLWGIVIMPATLSAASLLPRDEQRAGQPDSGLVARTALSQTLFLPAVANGIRSVTEPPAFPVDIRDKESVTAFFRAYYQDATRAEMEWTGELTSCNAGEISAAYRQALVNLVNFLRSMAGVPDSVVFLEQYNTPSQQAALMMSANRQLSHSPSPSWLCYSSAAAEAAGKSNLSLWWGNQEHGIQGQMRDTGDGNTAVGHRRWILCPTTQNMGVGNVPAQGENPAVTVLWVIDDHLWGPRPPVRDEFVAWPPSGYVPDALVYARWSFMLRDADFTKATVSVRYQGVALPLRVETIQSGYCENTLVWVPEVPWETLDRAEEHRFDVEITGVEIGGGRQSYLYAVLIFFVE